MPDTRPTSADPLLVIRAMHAGDVQTVASLHVASWRTAYRGILRDAFLDLDAAGNRERHWRMRLAATSGTAAGLVAERAGTALGFAYLVADADSARGTLLDNLHVLPEERGRGTGKRLLVAAAREVLTRGWPPGLHLWVFEANVEARRFYIRCGGQEVDRILHEAADGGTYPALCYSWNAIATDALAQNDDSMRRSSPSA